MKPFRNPEGWADDTTYTAMRRAAWDARSLAKRLTMLGDHETGADLARTADRLTTAARKRKPKL